MSNNISNLNETALNKIINFKGSNIILDRDVAQLYGVDTRRVNEAVKRNPDKFPKEYVITLTKEDVDSLRSQNATANISTRSRILPKAFTEKGLYMLATIIKSDKATEATIDIIETFAKIKEIFKEIKQLNENSDKPQEVEVKKISKKLSELLIDDISFNTNEIETTVELNMAFFKVKKTIKKKKK